MLYLDKGGVEDIGGRTGGLGSGGSPEAAAAGRSGGPPGDGHAPARVRLAQQLLGRAPELHHLHSQRLAHRGLCLPLQMLQRSVHHHTTIRNSILQGAIQAPLVL